MVTRTFLDLIKVTVGGACFALLIGCQGSTRSVNLGSKKIETETPIQLDRNSIPIAASPNGSRLALAKDLRPGWSRLDVVDVDTLASLGSMEVPNNGGGVTIFGKDGTTLYVGSEEGYVAWDYAKGSKTKLAGAIPEARSGGIFDGSGWNYDRSILINYSSGQLFPGKNSGRKAEPGLVLNAGSTGHVIAPDQTAGFDQYGNAWFGKGNHWNKMDREGILTKSSAKPGHLAMDQTKDRGSMHLRPTESTMKYQDGQARIACIWLTDDRSVANVRMDKGKRRVGHDAAVVFAGPDVYEFGFLPGRNLVYVVSGFGCYLVPFTIAPTK